MFAKVNPYDEIVTRTTDENLTGEDWNLIMTLCDKVTDEGEQGAQNVTAALLKRLAHRNANVQLYSLSLADSLVKNCKVDLRREVASKAFMAGIERIILDRTSHDKVRKKALFYIREWLETYENAGENSAMIDETYKRLQDKGYHFDAPDEPPPVDVADDVRRREEEELQRVLRLSMADTGGRGSYHNSYEGGSSSGAGGSGSYSQPEAPSVTKAQTTRMSSYAATTSAGPASPVKKDPADYQSMNGRAGVTYPSAAPAAAQPVPIPQPAVAVAPPSAATPVQSDEPKISRVRALHTFEATQRGELAFEKGDVIKVVDQAFKDWWRGQLRGKTGIFPVNYVEVLPDPTPSEIQKEAGMEAQVFAQAANIDRLLNMLRGLDPSRDNLADNDEIQELYRQSLSLRPRIVKLIDKYSQKKADLMGMNESFLKARKMFDRMMEESLAVHNPGVSLLDYNRAQQAQAGYDPRASVYAGYPQQGYPGYEQGGYPQDAQYAQQQQQYAQQQGYNAQQQGYDPNAYPAQQQPGYDQYGQQQAAAYQYNQQQPAAGQYDQSQAAAGQYDQAQTAYGQSPYPQQGAQFPEQNGQAAAQAYQDENARAWAEYYASQGLAPDGKTPLAQWQQQQGGQPQQVAAAPAPDPNQYAQPQQGAQQAPAPTAGYPAPQTAPTTSPSTRPLPDAYAQQPTSAHPGAAQAPPAQYGGYDQHASSQPQYPGYDQQQQQQPPPAQGQQYPGPQPGGPQRSNSMPYTAQPVPPPATSPQPGYPASAQGYPGSPPLADPYQQQYAAMHQGFANMGVGDQQHGAPAPPPTA